VPTFSPEEILVADLDGHAHLDFAGEHGLACFGRGFGTFRRTAERAARKGNAVGVLLDFANPALVYAVRPRRRRDDPSGPGISRPRR